VPANDRFRPDNRNCAQDGGKPAIEPYEQKTIGIVQIWSLRHPPAKHVDLLPQDQIFRLKLCSRPKERSQNAKNQHERISHQAASLPRSFPASTSNRIFGMHSQDEAEQGKHCPLTLGDSVSQSIRMRFSVHTPAHTADMRHKSKAETAAAKKSKTKPA